MLRELGIKVWFVNVVDLLKIQNVCENDQAISDERWAELFGCGEKPVLFAFHAYAGTNSPPDLEPPPDTTRSASTATRRKGSTTTPFDMLRLNNMDRWALAADVLRMVDADKFAEQIDEWRPSAPRPLSSRATRASITRPLPTGSGPTPLPQTAADGVLSATQLTAGDNE